MAQRPFSLKRERVQPSFHSRLTTQIAEVLVEHEIFHLSQTFSYGIPQELQGSVRVGSLVKVPFRNSERTGVVHQIKSEIQQAKPIIKVVNSWAFSAASLQLAEEVAHRYGVNTIDVMKFVPSAANLAWPEKKRAPRKQSRRRYLQYQDSSVDQLITHLEEIPGNSLVIFPTEREAKRFFETAVKSVNRPVIGNYGITNQKLARKLENEIRTTDGAMVVACRSGVFLQIPDLAELVIVDEQAEDYWEQRRPYWNVRDVGLIRSRIEKFDLTFLSSAPSMELTRLIDIGYVTLERRLPKLVRRHNFSFQESGYTKTIREGLKTGSVLVSVLEKGYAGSFLCRNCRNSPLCSCGALLRNRSKNRYQCQVCGFSTGTWSCRECGSGDKLYLRKGAERIQEELGKAFPGSPILISTADKPIDAVPPKAIVIATSGMQPADVRFAGLVLLDGELLLNRPGLKGEESLRREWFRALSLLVPGGQVFLSLSRSSRIAQDLLMGTPIKGCLRQLNERTATQLPPFYRIISVSGPNVNEILQNLKTEFPSIELSRASESNSMVIRVKVEESQILMDALAALQRYRSAARRELFRIQVDPYDV